MRRNSKRDAGFGPWGLSLWASGKAAFFSLCLISAGVSTSSASEPDCTGVDAWPAAMTFTHLKNANLLDNNTVDFSKTKVSRLASEKIGDDLYRQIHLVKYLKADGSEVSAVAVNDVSSAECSMSGVDVYVVQRKLGDLTK